MQPWKTPHRQNVTRTLLSILLALALFPIGASADEVKTTVRKVPYPTAPEPERPKKITLESAYNRWSVKVVWDRVHGIENSFEARLMTSDVIAGLANQLAKTSPMSEAQAQTLYEERCKKYYGSAERGAFGEKIVFMGHIELDSETYTAGQLNSTWQFSLLADDGKPLAPAKVEMGDVRLQKSGASGPGSWYRVFTITFDNMDPMTKKRVVTAGIHNLTLAIKGVSGEGRATFAFDPSAR